MKVNFLRELKGKKVNILQLFFLLQSVVVFSGTTDFIFSVTTVPETCYGNGALVINVNNTQASAVFDISVYLLPNTTTPIRSTTNIPANSTSFTHNENFLQAGSYYIVVKETIGGNSTQHTANATINNQIQTLNFTYSVEYLCGNNIVVTVSSGHPYSYALKTTGGTFVVTPQITSAMTYTFTNINPGNYVIAVTDVCNSERTLGINFTGVPAVYSFYRPVSSTSEHGFKLKYDCTHIMHRERLLYNNSTTLPNHVFPIQLTYTITPPSGGTPIVLHSVWNSNADNNELIIIPLYTNVNYYYSVTFTDACGKTGTKNDTLLVPPDTYTFDRSSGEYLFNTLYDCTTIKHIEKIYYNALPELPNFVFPLQLTYTISNPTGGASTVIHSTWNSAADNGEQVLIPLYENVNYNYTVTLTDACGNTATRTDVIHFERDFTVSSFSGGCGTGATICLLDFTGLLAPIQVTVTGFNPWEHGPFPNGSFTATFNNLESICFNFIGNYNINYSFTITDSCGKTVIKNGSVNFTTSNPTFVNGIGAVSCENTATFGSLANCGIFTSVKIVSAPATFPYPLPYTVPLNADSTSFSIQLNSGLYSFNYQMQSLSGTNFSYNTTINIPNYTLQSTIVPQFNCGSFYLEGNVTSNYNTITLYLQKYFPATNTWGHPITGVPFVDTYAATNSIIIREFNNVSPINQNIVTNSWDLSGQFRLVAKVFPGYSNFCIKTLSEFEINYNSFNINHYYIANCLTGPNEIYIDAVGIPPLNYQLISYNGNPILVDNGTNPLFSNVTSGIYEVRVSDFCNNSSIVRLNTNEPIVPVIRPENLCEGQNGSLFVNVPSFMEIQWTKDNDPTIIGTSNTLHFTPLQVVQHAGVYHAHLYDAQNPNTCFETVLSFEMMNSSFTPQAGTGQTVTIAQQNAGFINLFDYLTPPFDNFGTWTDISLTGRLNDYIFDATDLPAGTYQFDYVVPGFCGVTDTATVVINVYLSGVVANDDVLNQICIESTDVSGFNVLNNDNYNFAPIDVAQFTLETTTPDSHGVITVQPNGTLSINNPTAGASYTLTYKLYETTNPLNNDSATLTVHFSNDVLAPVISGTFAVQTISGCTISSLPAPANNMTYFTAHQIVITDDATPLQNLIITYIDEIITGSCSLAVKRHYTLTDSCAHSSQITEEFLVVKPDFALPPTGNATLSCASQVTLPTPPQVTDACGNVLTAGTPTVSTFPTCNGQVEYTFTFVDCAGHSHDWKFIYTIAISDFSVPADENTSVNCFNQINTPVPPPVTDACGGVIVPSTPNITGNTACSNAVVYQYTYSDCAGHQHIWTYTYHLLNQTTLTPPANAFSTVSHIDQVVEPENPPNIVDDCGNIVTAHLVETIQNPQNIVCYGDVIWKYQYTSCNGTTVDWTYTYHIDGIPTAPLGNNPQIFCNSKIYRIADIVVINSGTNSIRFYASLEDYNQHHPLPLTTELYDNMVVYISQVTPDGCESTDLLQVQIDLISKDCDALIPNVFTPNNDGYNDTFIIPFLNSYPDYQIKIFNRWGSLVYQYNNDNLLPVSGWWDGKANVGYVFGGRDLMPSGVYYYIVELNSQNEKPLQGWIYLSY